MLVYILLALLISQWKEAIVRPYEDRNFIYYTITSEMTGGAWAMTGFKSKVSPEQGIRWLTAAHYFPLSMEPQVIPASINGQTEYINEIAPLGNDLCVFRFGPDSTFMVNGFSQRGPKESFDATLDISLDEEGVMGFAFYLVDYQEYPVIGNIIAHDADEDINGYLIVKESKSGDCGTALLYDERLCIITKSIPPGMPTPQGATTEHLTVAVPVSLSP